MLGTIEETLRVLRETMEHHRRSLAGEVSSPVSLPAPAARSSSPPRWVADVGAELERAAGVQMSDTIAAKLERLFAGSDSLAIDEWLRRVRRPGSLHPDLQLLIESLTTHETFFFRDPAQLRLLRTTMLPKMIEAARASGRRRLRLWSAGCATGEEAYSLAIVALLALHDAGEGVLAQGRVRPMPGWTIEALGTDISGRALDVATSGVYGTGGLSSFRDVPSELLIYLQETEDGKSRRVHDELREFVRFQRFNLIDTQLPIAECDIVACRNVLIYLTAECRRRVQDSLHRALRPGGCLLLGPTDSLVDPGRFESHWSDTGIVHSRRPGV
ncbi:MAG: protein-glutamate O-methyltransferase CheR [Alphaproteobacteria bacterium]|nr:protein-glutamate O-methyltransferase CheR [Alphaproteobacteria bacterium]